MKTVSCHQQAVPPPPPGPPDLILHPKLGQFFFLLMSCDASEGKDEQERDCLSPECGEGVGTHWTQGARRELNEATATGGMEVRLGGDQGWTPHAPSCPLRGSWACGQGGGHVSVMWVLL